MKKVTTNHLCRNIALIALFIILYPLQSLLGQLPAPTSVTATPSTINLGQSTNLNATSSGNDIRWYTTSSGGTSIGTSGSGSNFSVSPTANTTYYAEAYKASSSADLKYDAHDRSITSFFFRAKAKSGAITITGFPVQILNSASTFTATIYYMQKAWEWPYGQPGDLYSSANWTSLGTVSLDNSSTYIDLPSDITIPNNSTYSFMVFAGAAHLYFGAGQTTCTTAGYTQCSYSDAKLEISWVGGKVNYTGDAFSGTYCDYSGFFHGGVRYTIPEQTSSSRTSASVTVNTCGNPSSAGSISSSQTICYNTVPAQLTGTTPSGHAGTLQYQWQSSANNSTWADETGATSVNYTPGALTASTYFRRNVKVTCESTWLNSTSILITTRQQFNPGTISTAGQTINYNGDPGEIGNSSLATGGNGSFTYSWQKSTTSDTAGYSTVSGATSPWYNPPGNLTATTWYRRLAKDGLCNTTPVPSTGVHKVTVITPSVVTTAVSSIKTDSAMSGGNTIDDQNAVISSKGVVWSNTSSPTTALTTKTIEPVVPGSEDADFSSYITGLSANSRYYTRAYIVNSIGTFYGNELNFYTTAYVPAKPSLTNIKTTGIDVTINNDNNPSATEYAIDFTWNPSKWVQAAGTLGDAAVWQTKSVWGTKPVTGLEVNTRYVVKIKARNGSNAETDFGIADTTYTLANIPSAPGVNAPTTSSLNVAINVNGNPSITQFAIRDTVSGKYVQVDGTLGILAAWQTEAQWETAASNTARTVSGLNPNTRYAFQVKARNGDLTETSFSGAASLYTLANIPSPPYVFNPTANTLDIAVNFNGNPVTTQFAIMDSVNLLYLHSDGSRSVLASWEPGDAWDTTTVTGLNVGGTYYFRVKAKNGNNIETVYSLSTAGTTCLNPATGGVIGSAQTICYNTAPVTLTETTAPTGFAGTLEYQWQSSATGDSVSFTDISGATSKGYSPGQLTDTTYFLRLVRVTCKTDWVRSNILKITVHPDFAKGSIETTGDTICYNGDPVLIGNDAPATGGDGNISYQWQSSVSGPASGFNNIDGATASSFDPPAGLTDTTWYRRMAYDGACNTTPTASTGVWKVTVYPQLIVGSISAAQTICEGSIPAELTGIAPSGGNIPYSYQWQVSEDNSDFTNITGATTINFQPDTLIQSTWYRLLQTSASNCGTLTTDTVEVTVDPTTVGGSVSGDTLVCYGSHSSVLNLSGQTGSVLKWQYSTDDNSWVDLTGHTSTTYTAENLVMHTSFRAVVQSGVCLIENSTSHKVKVFTNYKISGTAKYDNNPKTPLNGLKVLLWKGSSIVDSVITNNQGFYQFDSLTNGSFGLIIKSASPGGNWQTWGGVTNTDYLLVSKHADGSQLLPANPPVIRKTASVKVPHPLINAADASAIRQAAKFPTTGYSYFEIPKWVFSGLDQSTRIDTMELNCADLTRDIRGLCAGDVNGSYVPPAGYKTVETLHATSLQLTHQGNLPISNEIIFPVRVARDMELGAITLYLDFDPTVITVTNVTTYIAGTDFWFNVTEPSLNLQPSTLNTLQIGWMSVEPVSVSQGQTMIMIHARLRNTVVETHGSASLPVSHHPIRFTLNDQMPSELADGDGIIVENATLTMPDAGSNKTADGNVDETEWVSCYPNPVKDILHVEFIADDVAEMTNPAFISLMTMQGAVVFRQNIREVVPGLNTTTMDIASLPTGAYMLKFEYGSVKKVKKIVVIR